MLAITTTIPFPVSFFQNIEWALMPIFGWFSTLLDSVTIKREWKKQAKAGISEAIHGMRTYKQNFFMSVEGKRSESHDGTLSPYKNGAAVLAIAADAIIVPVVVHGMWNVLPYGAAVVPDDGRHVRTVYLPAIDCQQLNNSERHDVTQHLRELCESELGRPLTNNSIDIVHDGTSASGTVSKRQYLYQRCYGERQYTHPHLQRIQQLRDDVSVETSTTIVNDTGMHSNDDAGVVTADNAISSSTFQLSSNL
jgi:1-acyl-sn-glycerol-3-phosphate acyltransferase